MEESTAYIPHARSPSSPRPRPRKVTTSFSSQASAGRPSRLKTPVSFAHRYSPVSMMSNGSGSAEIIAPIPRRHHILQASESAHWLGSPTLSTSSSRPVSPFSLNSTGTISPTNSTTARRLSHRLSFGSLKEQSGSPRPMHARKERRHEHDDGGMGRRWIRWMHKHGMKQWILPCSILASVWVKWAVGLGSYSGQGTPPMFGDYEAQRHWMELTIHLPTRQWYTYDLQYWGLDYPPLTAYVSWLCGALGHLFDPTWFALDASRGYESPDSKVYMRTTVLIFDTLIYVPALYLFVKIWHASRSGRTQEYALLVLLLHPALLLIDFGHFQYNSVMLGLTLFAMNYFATGRDLLGAFFFVMSLSFKQMALYYAPAIGSYLLGKCLYLGHARGLRHFAQLVAVTLLTTIALFLPFLPPFAALSSVLDPITRIFPFNRGLFEDKVANFWCASDVLIKWRRRFGSKTLVRFATCLTALGFLPAAGGLLYGGWKLRLQPPVPLQGPSAGEESKHDKPKADVGRAEMSEAAPTLSLLPYALLTSSLSFFLFSFQVHEKTILLPLLPLTLLLSGSAEGSETWEMGLLANNIAVFSMWPLLKRDGQGLAYVALTILWNRMQGYNPFWIRPTSLLQYLSLVVHIAALAVHVLEMVFTPPARYPDLFPVLNVLLSMPIFALVWLWSIRRGIEIGWALGGPGPAGGAAKPVHPRASNEGRPSEGSSVSSHAGSGIRREAGARAISLGYAQSRRRQLHRSESISSVLSVANNHGNGWERERDENQK